VAWPGQENPVTAAGRGHMRASHADRDRVIDTLKAAFVQGRLTRDEFDARVGRTLASRTYAELATVTAGIPAGPPRAQPPPKPARRQVSNVTRWGTSGLITPAILAAAFAFASMPGDRRYGAIGLVIAFVYFVFWLSAGADMLWDWYCRRHESASGARTLPHRTVRRGPAQSGGVRSNCGDAANVPAMFRPDCRRRPSTSVL
jgi:hypothetical protein